MTPIPVLVLLLWLLWSTPSLPVSTGLEAVLGGLGVLAALAGELLRFWTLGQVPEGTSGQGFELQAERLNTQGPYAYLRNPLYLGNLLICVGLMLVANNGWIDLIGLSFFFGQYFLIIRAEESFLSKRHGQEFAAYLQRVPRWLPRFTPAYLGKLCSHFDLRRALWKEHNPFAAWASGLILLSGWKCYQRGRLEPAAIAVLVALELFVAISFLLIKGHKHRWFERTAAK